MQPNKPKPGHEPSLEELARRAERAVATTIIEGGLKITIDGKTFVANPGDVLGREGTVGGNCFLKYETVSRRHVEISKNTGRWFITVPASVTNSTQLDEVELPRGQPVPLCGKHTLKMSKTCVVTLEV